MISPSPAQWKELLGGLNHDQDSEMDITASGGSDSSLPFDPDCCLRDSCSASL